VVVVMRRRHTRELRSAQAPAAALCLLVLLIANLALTVRALLGGYLLLTETGMTASNNPLHDNLRGKLATLRDLGAVGVPVSATMVAPSLTNLLALAAEPPPETNGVVGAILKFNKVGFFKGRAKEAVPLGTRLMFVNSRDGMCYFDGQMSDPSRTIWRNGQGLLPKRDTLGETDPSQWRISDFNGKPVDPWQHSYFIYFFNKETCEYLTFVTQSGGGRIAVHELAGRVAAHSRDYPDAYPEIELQMGSWDTAKFSDIARPSFPIVGWCDRHGRPLDTSGPVIEATAVNDNPPFDIEGAAEAPLKRPTIIKRPTAPRRGD